MNSFRESVTCYRVSEAGSWDGGFYDPGDADEFTILASVQPLTAAEMMALPEGRRTTQAYKLYSDTQLLPGDQGQVADIVVIDDVQYEVIACEYWRTTSMAHYKAVVARPAAE